MKKLIALALVALMLIPAVVYACEETLDYAIPLPKIETVTEEMTECAWFAVDETRHIVGKWSASAREEIFSATSEEAPFILGILDNGVVRAKGELRYTEMGGMILGLTKLKCTVRIYGEYTALVSEIVETRTGETMSAAAVIAASQWRTSGTIYHVFFITETPKIPVGVVYLNGGKNAVTLYAGEFEGVLVLGFMAGGIPYQPTETTEEPEPETTPEPAATPEPIVNTVYVRETVVREVVKETVKEPACVRVIQNNYQTIVNSAVTNTQKVIVNSTISSGGCRKAIPENCVKD